MAQLDSAQRYSVESIQTPTSPTREQIIQGKASSWHASTAGSTSHHASPRYRKDHFEESHSFNSRKSVLARAREKAKRWRQNLVKKTFNQQGEGWHNQQEEGNTAPRWGVTLKEEDENSKENPEFYGAPMYGSELAPEGYRETARQHPREVTDVSEKHVLPSSIGGDAAKTVDNKEKPLIPNETIITETTVSAPADETVTEEVAHMLPSNIRNLTIGIPTAEAGQGSGQQHGDEGVSAKKYLLQKLEPMEDDKALSQKITNAISPRKAPGEPGMVDKVKGIVNSLLWHEESSQESSASSHIPISTNASEVVKEENQGRILQVN